ncbi:MAG: hypothetical protein M3Y25_05710 [Thermoproteota archaeon]|nr:hypothetical protein [Thermoproteota archaeon]
MSLSTYEQASRTLAIKIISQDTELTAKMYRKNIQTSEIYLIFRQRLALYDKVSRMPLTEIDQLLLESKKTEISMDLKMFRFKQNIEEELSQVISRLKELEDQLATLKK